MDREKLIVYYKLLKKIEVLNMPLKMSDNTNKSLAIS